MREIGRHRHAVDRNSAQGAEGDPGGVEVFASLGDAGPRRLQPLFGLLLVGDADRALGDAFAKVARKGSISIADQQQAEERLQAPATSVAQEREDLDTAAIDFRS